MKYPKLYKYIVNGERSEALEVVNGKVTEKKNHHSFYNSHEQINNYLWMALDGELLRIVSGKEGVKNIPIGNQLISGSELYYVVEKLIDEFVVLHSEAMRKNLHNQISSGLSNIAEEFHYILDKIKAIDKNGIDMSGDKEIFISEINAMCAEALSAMLNYKEETNLFSSLKSFFSWK